MKKWLTDNYLYLLLLAAFMAIEIFLIFPVWSKNFISYDSSYQFFLTQHSLSEMWELIPQDYSPPLYAFLLKFYTLIFGNSLFIMRTMNLFVLFGMLTAALFPLRRLFGGIAGIACSAFIMFSSNILLLLDEIRPTLLGMLFLLCTAIYAADVLYSGKKSAYIKLGVFTVLGMYTHNITMLGELGVFLVLIAALLIKKDFKKLKSTIICGAAVSVLYIPWLVNVFKQFTNVKDHFWSRRIELTGLFDLFTNSSIKSNACYIFEVGFIVLIIIWIFRLFDWKKLKKLKSLKELPQALSKFVKTHSEDYKKLLFLFALAFAALGIIAVFHFLVYLPIANRYVYILGVLWLVFLSAVIQYSRQKLAPCVIVLSICLNSFLTCKELNELVNESEFGGWVESVKAENAGKDISFIHTHEWSVGIMSYYFPEAKHYVYKDTFTVLNTYDVFTTEIIELNKPEDVWNYTDKVYYVQVNSWDPSYIDEGKLNECLQAASVEGGTGYYISHGLTFMPCMLKKAD